MDQEQVRKYLKNVESGIDYSGSLTWLLTQAVLFLQHSLAAEAREMAGQVRGVLGNPGQGHLHKT
jgi:hypothetical protein